MFYPICTSIGVPVKCLEQSAYRLLRVGLLLRPPCWSLFRREAYPSWRAFHLGLEIRLLSINHFKYMSQEATIKVSRFRGLQCGWCTSHVAEGGFVMVLSTTEFPRKTTRPLYFLCSTSISESCSPQMPAKYPRCTSNLLSLASLRTPHQSRGLSSSQAYLCLNLVHSWFIAWELRFYAAISALPV